MLDSAKLLMMEIPYSREELIEACKLTVRESGLDSCYVRPIAYLGYGEIGLNPLACSVNVSTDRATFGAVQNRLQHTLNNLGNYQENLSAAESSIKDVDMASEMVNFTKLQVLQQAGMSMLAQANQSPQSVLSLLR